VIGKLKGLVDATGDGWVIVDVGGVGYEVHCASRTLARLPARGQPVELAIETHVREDAIRLFGFANELERRWFRLLHGVQGVGTRLALAILLTLEPNEIANAIALGDKGAISRAPGVGPKVAQRLIGELRDKAPGLVEAGAAAAALPEGADMQDGSAMGDAVSALTNLGYPAAQAAAAVATAMREAGDDAPTETLIRLGLKELAT
jgi:Holliday junction DNA helicase RuvA